jgi:hypothetical protein
MSSLTAFQVKYKSVKSCGVSWEYNGSVRKSDGVRHGQGTCTYSDGDVYVGEWRDGEKKGAGTYTSARGDVSEGVWANDKLNGSGKETFADVSYEGEFKDNNWHGRGKETRDDGSTYEGQFRDGKRHGTGRCALVNGSIHEGSWEDNKLHGHGKVTSQDGAVFVLSYEGQFNSGNWHGRGRVTYASGEVYDGQWKDGKRCTCPENLTKDNIHTLHVDMLVDFWGAHSSKGPRRIEGTLADSQESALKKDDKALLICLNEGENAQGQLCYRHLVTVLEVGCARSAHENQVLLNYDQFKAAKHNTWISNRSSLLEHATAERRKERLVFNAMYEKVREHKFPRAQRKRK